MSTVLVFAGIFLCLCLSNFCSASEMAFSSCNVMRLENARDDGSKRAKIAVYITEHFDDALSAILIGNNLANIGASSLASVAVILVTGGDEYAWLATIILTVLVIIFGETMPKISAKKNANRTSLKNAYVVRAMMIIFYPLVWLVVSLIKLLTMGMKPEAADADSDEAVEELQSIIETAEDEDVLDEDQSELVQAAIDFSETSAFEVMTARVDVQAIDIEDDWDDILAIIEDAPFTRLPVYEGSIDNIIGVLQIRKYVRVYLRERKYPELRSLLDAPCFVHQSTSIDELLEELNRQKVSLAVVTDNYGGTMGIVTVEDIIEELVGEIWDEDDVAQVEFRALGGDTYEVSADMDMEDLFDELGYDDPENTDWEHKPVGEWVYEQFDMIPAQGESFTWHRLKVTVEAIDHRRIRKLLIRLLPEETQEGGEEA